ncbi:PLP-dependent aminotransferase family protein [Neptuniibacter sp.]|uniref:aminotransferase-like domain-containing protein n=1 Tax=Neptuniibacter sp. TaxID=1962643 RepID=UPI0026313F31|nr:PLP-dependent aminotransferase family protein [Neptuniibacter sp.]MCP4596299.1 PLP-dependent aminotransferase family protein [Neptuniibacter sp.]
MSYLYQDLEIELTELIRSGELPVGTKLPSIRQQCLEQNLSKATVLHAYQRLEAAGLIEARFKSGFYVCSRTSVDRLVPSAPDVDTSPQLVDMSDLMRDVMEHSAAFDICPQDAGYAETPVGITELNRCIGRALRSQRGNDHAYYDEPAGLQGLRQVIAERYNRMGCRLSAEDVSITAGCQHALSLALQSCCQPGDIVAVESPGFYGVLQLIESMGLKALEIPATSEEGISVESLQAALQSWPVKACVVTPAFSTPTGALLPQQSRSALLDLAEQYDFKIIEDDIYGDLAFAQRPAPLKQIDRNNRVILCGSYSKALSRQLRLGWIISSQQKEIKRLKMVNLLALSRFTQQGLLDFITDGGYDKHLRKQKLLLQQQRDQLLLLLDQHWSRLGSIRVSQPAGGVALWVELEPEYDFSECYLKAREAGVLITPGNLFTAQDNRYRNCLRLSYVHPWNSRREEALKALAEIMLASK